MTDEPLDDTAARLNDSAVLMSEQGSTVRLLNLLAVPTDEVLFAVPPTRPVPSPRHATTPEYRRRGFSTATEVDLLRT